MLHCPLALILGPPLLLILLQPDLGTMLVLSATVFGVLRLLPSRLIDRPKQLVEARGFLARPDPAEGGTQEAQVPLREQADGHRREQRGRR